MYKIGETITFGKYDWLVLDVQDGKALITTIKLVDQRPFDSKYNGVAWDNCDLRQWLNSEFLQQFSHEEQSKIIETLITTPINPHQSEYPWHSETVVNNTNDKIFLLSVSEVEQYLPNTGDRTPIYDDPVDGPFEGFWWLRTSGIASGAVYVRESWGNFFMFAGHIDFVGADTTNALGCVRPTLWLKFVNEKYEESEND